MSSHFATSHNASASTSLLSAGGGSGGSVAQVVMKATAVAATKPYVFSSSSFPSLPVQTESVITRWLYKHADTSIKAAHGCGLLSPLWLWTHACYTESQRLERSSAKAVHLAQWLSRNLVERRHIAIVCPHPSMVRQVAEDLKSAKCDVVVLLPNDIPSALRRKHGATEAAASLAADAGAAGPDNSSTTTTSSSVHTTYHHIIYLLPEVPNQQTIKTMTSLQEQCLSAAMSAATTSCTIIADATWLLDSVKGRWKGWGAMVDKLALQSLQHEGTSVVHIPGRDDLAVPGNPAEGHGRGLMGPKLPVCCGAHHDQFTFYSGLQSDLYPCSTTTSNTSSSQHHHNNDSSSSVVTFCKRLCLHLHQCRRPEHMCGSTCHRAADHRACPFACNNVLPCGHPCKMECAERCNCLVVTRERLPCSHQIVVGLDPETQLALYATIPHEFHGFCVDRGGPCVVEVPSTCATCLGPLTAPCHVLQQAGHTMEQRTVSCPSCQQAERDIRSNALAEVLVDTEQRKREMKVDLARTVHEQRKGAASGIFRIGARVVIRHSSKAIAPIDPEADFPNVPFVDYDADDFTAALTGSMGIIVSQHVDVDDPAELRSLVRLSTGKYVLVGDGGMEFIRADVSAAVSGGGGGGTPLLLLMGPSSGEAKEEQEDEEELKKLSAQRSAMKGKWFIVMTTVRIPASSHMHPDEQPTPATAASSHCSHKGNEEGGNTDDAMNDDGNHSVAGSISSDDESYDLVLNEVVVEVVGDDPQRRGQWVEVQCTLFDRLKETQALEEQLSSPQRPPKRSREEEGGDTDHNAAMDGAHHDIAAAADNDTSMHDAIRVIRFSVRMADLDPLPFALGRDVFITHPQYQVTSAELLAILKDAVKAQLQYKVVAEAAPTITSMLSSTTATTTLNKNAEEVALLLQRLEKQACMWSLTMTPDKSVRVECIINAPRFQPKDMERGLHRVCRGPMCLLSAESGSNNNNNNPTTNRGRVVASYRATEHRGRPAPTRQPATTSTGIALPPPQPPQLMFVPLVYVAADEVTNAMNRMDDEAQTRWATLVQERLQAQFEARALRNDEIAYQQQLAMPPVTEEMALQLSQPHISCPVPLPSKEEVMRLTLRARALPVGDANAVRLLEAKDSAQKKLATMRGKQFHVHLHQQTKDDHDSLAKYMLSVEPKIH